MSEAADETPAPVDTSDRVFLVVVDETEEMKVALRFACLRARRTGGRVALLYVIEPA
ncbi:MAG: universal stress protein, partial [Proteobacteria bacterium]|nr:universal stress protein [Pseudomonadota bacterium]